MSLPVCHESATLLRAMTAPVSPTAARIGVVSDVHVTPDVDRTGRWNELIHYDRALPRLTMALEWFEEEDVDAILVLGDLTEDGDRDSLAQALDAVQDKVDRPTYVFAGNHDGALLGELSQQVDARPPLALVPDGLVRGVPFGTAHVDWHGGFRFTAQLEAPETDDLLVVATHFPLISRVRAIEARGLRYAGDLEDVETHTKTLGARTSPTVVLSAHLHVDDAHAEGRTLQLVNPPVVEGDGGASLVTVEPLGVVHREVRALDGRARREHTYRYADGRWTSGS
jgi:predicted phosphodiesterase